ncbi:hypothetical protein Maq22A_2p42675 (plasmid) [Methylobacterium aquaticum]|uniref:Transposase n=1 Tax=Methylobacterium aquaticum TaxID=270351 RepID=A0A1Y0ZIZ7_9HYPH|nr:hypothetical protein Maq22A_2p42675 [Methylobacterium aquaticum]
MTLKSAPFRLVLERLTGRHDRVGWALGWYGSPASPRRSLNCNRPASTAAPASPEGRASSGERSGRPDRHPVLLRSGIAWEMLPAEMKCGCGMSCWRRLREWQPAGV